MGVRVLHPITHDHLNRRGIPPLQGNGICLKIKSKRKIKESKVNYKKTSIAELAREARSSIFVLHQFIYKFKEKDSKIIEGLFYPTFRDFLMILEDFFKYNSGILVCIF